MLPYDTYAYMRTLTHLGQPAVIDGLPWPVVIRQIPGSDQCDALGPWPYGSAPDPAKLGTAVAALRAHGLLTLTAMLRPDGAADLAALEQAGLTCVPLKAHFVHDFQERLPAHSKKTRYNIAAARRRWTVERLDIKTTWPGLAAMHAELSIRRRLSKIARLETSHFERLAAVPGVDGLVVFDQGELVAALVVVRSGAAVHFHALVGNDQAYRERAHYALYEEALSRWGQERLLCMGGVPAGEDGEGIGKFKGRFATSTRAVTLVQLVVDAAACAELTAQRHTPGYFPPYRTPGD